MCKKSCASTEICHHGKSCQKVEKVSLFTSPHAGIIEPSLDRHQSTYTKRAPLVFSIAAHQSLRQIVLEPALMQSASPFESCAKEREKNVLVRNTKDTSSEATL